MDECSIVEDNVYCRFTMVPTTLGPLNVLIIGQLEAKMAINPFNILQMDSNW